MATRITTPIPSNPYVVDATLVVDSHAWRIHGARGDQAPNMHDTITPFMVAQQFITLWATSYVMRYEI